MRDGVWSAAFNPDGLRVMTVGSDNTAHVWEAATGNEISALVGQSNKLGVSLKKARFNANGRRVLTVSNDDNARLWDTESGEENHRPGSARPPDQARRLQP